MDIDKLIGMRVMNGNTHAIGTIKYIRDGYAAIDFRGEIIKFAYPSAFSGILELEDEELQEEIQSAGMDASFDYFKRYYKLALNNEIDHLKLNGGRKYRIVDGEKLISKNGEHYLWVRERLNPK